MDQRVITGQSAADGIAIGRALVTSLRPEPPEGCPASDFACCTLADFLRAVQATRDQLRQFQQHMQERMAESASSIFAVHLAILDDPGFTGRIQALIAGGTPVRDAIDRITGDYIALFTHSANPRFKEKVDDLRDITRRILAKLANPAGTERNADYQGRILITPKLFPSDILRFAAEKGEGIILTSGGVTAHISVLARSLDMPMVLADAKLLAGVDSGAPLLLDAHAGRIFVNPDPKIVAEYASLLETHGRVSRDECAIEPQTYTRDRRRIRLLAAIGLVSEAKLAHDLRAEGVGLYRSEIPFLIRNDFPTEDEQIAVYRKVMDEMGDGEIVFRTLDIGGDKILHYFPPGEESNPFLGLRGIRFTLHHPRIFETQVRAVLRASHDRPLKIMFPLISSVDSFRRVRDLVKKIARKLHSENMPHQSDPEIGAMIELPCAIGIADELAAETDFLSLGTNDLVQYMLAVDRTNEHVADWNVPWHPAILRAIKTVADAALRHGKPLSICGDMAHTPAFIPVLIGMGLTAFTIPPHRIAPVQKIIQATQAAEAEALSRRVLATATVAEIARLLGIPYASPR